MTASQALCKAIQVEVKDRRTTRLVFSRDQVTKEEAWDAAQLARAGTPTECWHASHGQHYVYWWGRRPS